MKITKGPLAGVELRFAPSRREYNLRDEVQKVARWLGCTAVMCTDESTVGDFMPPRWRVWYVALRARMLVNDSTLLVDIAERIKRP